MNCLNALEAPDCFAGQLRAGWYVVRHPWVSMRSKRLTALREPGKFKLDNEVTADVSMRSKRLTALRACRVALKSAKSAI